MSKLGVVSILLALGLNLSCVLLGTDYLWSVLLVFGGMGAFFMANGWKHFTRRDVMVIVTLLLISDVMTVVIEKLMIYFDVWGFSNRQYRLMGIELLGAPIEEFIYWWLCPVVVAFAYIAHLRTDTVEGPTAFHALELALLARYGTDKLQASTRPDHSDYLQTDGVVDRGDGTYQRGQRKPTYFWIQLFVVALIVLFIRTFKGSWKAVAWTVAVFVATAFPNEAYSISKGFWVYNENRLLGISFLHIPLEGWMMYFLCPLCACLMLDALERLYGKFGA